MLVVPYDTYRLGLSWRTIVLLCRIVAVFDVNLSTCKYDRLDNAWKTMLYKICAVSGDALKFVCAYIILSAFMLILILYS